MSTENELPREYQAFIKIDHIAVAVKDLDVGIHLFCNVLGFSLKRRREVRGRYSGMLAAEVEHNGIYFVLVQGTEAESQVSHLVNTFGTGVAHIALAVDDAQASIDELSNKGLSFDTNLISGPGLKQAFSTRDPNTGLSFEIIERSGVEEFLDENVHELFSQLEKSGNF